MRELVRRRLEGNLPPIPQQPDTDMQKTFPKYLRADGKPIPRAEMACVDDPHAGRTCIGLPSDQELDEPAIP